MGGISLSEHDDHLKCWKASHFYLYILWSINNNKFLATVGDQRQLYDIVDSIDDFWLCIRNCNLFVQYLAFLLV